jgi:curved DNA-binding protein CbpA
MRTLQHHYAFAAEAVCILFLMEEVEVDWYGILDCSIESTKEQIEKAARQLARKYHPDRNKDPLAAPLFLNVQKAKEFLLDDEKRRGYDENFKKKIKRKEYDQQRYQHMDSRRKKMKEDLEARLGKVQKSFTTSTEEESVRKGERTSNLPKKEKQPDLNELRQDSMNRMNEARAKQEAERNNISLEEILKHRQSMADSSNQETILQIKVKWKRSDVSHSDDSLWSLFRDFGSIEDVTMSAGGKTNTAIITFGTNIAAQAAVNHYLDSTTLKVTLLSNEPKKASIFTHTYQQTTTTATSSSQSTTPSGRVESDLMREVRRAVERDELIKQMSTMASSSRPPSSSTFSTSAMEGQSGSLFGNAPSSAPPVNFAAKENDILARMMAAKSAKSSAAAVPMQAA